MFRPLSLAIALTAVTLASGCARGFDINTPDGFAELDDNDHYRYRSTSADGVVIAVRREKNEPRASLDFWTAALKNDLANRGYSLVKSENVESKNGIAGRQLRYTLTKNGRPNVLWVTVYVTEKRVFVVEAGGDQAPFGDSEKKLASAIGAIEIG